MAMCDCEDFNSSGADFLRWVRREAIKEVEAVVRRNRPPEAAFTVGVPRLIATVPSGFKADAGFPRGAWELFYDLSGWLVEIPARPRYRLSQDSVDGVTAIAVATLKQIAYALTGAIIAQLTATHRELIAAELTKPYEPELRSLRALGYDNVSVDTSDLDTPMIRVELGHIGGVHAYVELGNTQDGWLRYDAGNENDEDQNVTEPWSAVVREQDPSPSSDLDIVVCSRDIGTAVALAKAELLNTTRVAVRTRLSGDEYVIMRVPIDVLGDYEAEAAALEGHFSYSFRSPVIVVDGVDGFPAGCSTHSHYDSSDRDDEQLRHADCEHELFGDDLARRNATDN